MFWARRAAVGSGLLAAATVLLAGCSSLGPDAVGVEQSARAWHRAIDAGHGHDACALVAPRTAEELEDQAEQPCDKAITGQAIPSAARVLSSDVHGRNARVVLDGDTVFLSRFDRGWLVIAAGCVPMAEDRPYKCILKGG